MGNASAQLRADNENDEPAPDYEPDGYRVTLTIHSGGTIENGVYFESDASNTYKYDHVLPHSINVKSIKSTAENLYAGKEFFVWVSLSGKLKIVRDNKLLLDACAALGNERDLHVYVVEKRAEEELHDVVENNSNEGSPNVSDFSDSDEPYEYDMKEDSDEETESEGEENNVFERQSQSRKVPDVAAKDKGKGKVSEMVVDEENSEEDIDDVNVLESGDELGSPLGSDDDGRTRHTFPTFNTDDIFNPKLELGMLFTSKRELKLAIQSYAINEKRSIKFVKNDKRRLYAKCVDPQCSWLLRGLAIDNQTCFRIRELVHEHKCKPKTAVENVSSTWLASKFKDKFINDPRRNMSAWRVETISELKIHVTEQQAYKTKYKALKLIDGIPEKQYEMLWSFAEEVKRSNPGSTVVIETDGSSGRNIFDRMYICLQALKEGFKIGCRPVICLDGCWLKGMYGGVLLTACGIDANNSYLPIAYAVVEKENAEIWGWFMRILKQDLNVEDPSKFTLMSDKQKGLIQAELEEFPGAEYRFCARHLLVNFRNAGFKGEAFKKYFWKAAKCTTINSFEKVLEQIHNIDPKAAAWLREKPPSQWCRAYFREFSHCDLLTNNACETFNANILSARNRPILTMFQQIHVYLMSRFVRNRETAKKSKKWKEVLCPRVQEIIDGYTSRIPDYMPIQSDDYNFQVGSLYNQSEQYCVDLKNALCGCRKWQLSGLPCIHAIVALNFLNLDVEPYTHRCNEVHTYRKTYAMPILPMNGSDEWPKTSQVTILPPVVVKRKPGRPPTERRLEAGERASKSKKKKSGRVKILPCGNKISRNQLTVKCSVCGGSGHNAKSCKERRTYADAMQIDNVVEASTGNNPIIVMQNVSMVQLQNSSCVQAPIVSHVTKRKVGRPKSKEKAMAKDARADSVSNMQHDQVNPTVESEQTLMSYMTEMPPVPSQGEGSQRSINMVVPAKFDPKQIFGSYADLSGPVPAIIKDGKKFMTLGNILKKSELKRQKM